MSEENDVEGFIVDELIIEPEEEDENVNSLFIRNFYLRLKTYLI